MYTTQRLSDPRSNLIAASVNCTDTENQFIRDISALILYQRGPLSGRPYGKQMKALLPLAVAAGNSHVCNSACAVDISRCRMRSRVR